VHIKSRTTLSIDFAEANETNKRSMSSAKPLREFKHMDWVPIDYGDVFGKKDRSLTKRGWQEHWKQVSQGKASGKFVGS
jgi:hypothetical protein